MKYQTIILKKKDGIAEITLNRPPLNAVNETLLAISINEEGKKRVAAFIAQRAEKKRS